VVKNNLKKGKTFRRNLSSFIRSEKKLLFLHSCQLSLKCHFSPFNANVTFLSTIYDVKKVNKIFELHIHWKTFINFLSWILTMNTKVANICLCLLLVIVYINTKGDIVAVDVIEASKLSQHWSNQNCCTHPISGLGNVRPAGHIRPAKHLNVARELHLKLSKKLNWLWKHIKYQESTCFITKNNLKISEQENALARGYLTCL